jgi:hypothetical protein
MAMTLTEMPRRTRRTQQHRVKEAPNGAELARTFYDLAQFHESHGRAAEAVANYSAALQLDLGPGVRAYCRAYLAENLFKVGRFEEARRRAVGILAESEDPELTSFLTNLVERIEQRLDPREE